MNCSDLDRRLRVEYPDAIYHMTSRGVRREDIFADDRDRNRFWARCQAVVDRFGWLLYSTVQMTNHFHLLFKTPEANLCRGAQYLLGPYARYFNLRHGRSGHVFEGRYRCRVIEDEAYLWTVSRYIHLNPVPALVPSPVLWPWSSYVGFVDPSRRLPWIQYDRLLDAWEGAHGSRGEAYQRFVEGQLGRDPEELAPQLIDGWIIGSASFAAKIRKLVSPKSREPLAERTRRRPTFTLEDVCQQVMQEYKVTREILATKSHRHPARRVLALLAHQLSTATLREISTCLGLSGPDSVHKLIEHTANDASAELRTSIQNVRCRLLLP